jgi:hypothetical protein
MTRSAIAALIAAGVLEGCTGSAGTQSPLVSMQGPKQLMSGSRREDPRSASCVSKPCIFVANPVAYRRPHARILIYGADASGNVAPLKRIRGKKTELVSPGAVAVDDDRNIYVINSARAHGSSVTVYAAGAGGNVAPIQKISGSNTDLVSPASIAVDASHNIYIEDKDSNERGSGSVTVFAAGANGNVTPIRLISGSNTGLTNTTTGIAVDPNGSIYVGDACCVTGGSVLVYAAGATGNVAPVRTITGPNTGLTAPQGVAVDAGSNVYISNVNNSSVTVYAAGANGDVPPIQTISGANTGLGQPYGLALDAGANIYALNYYPVPGIVVFAAGSNGNVFPIRTISGSKTDLRYPFGIAAR